MSKYVDRDLAWLEFNDRVLQQAEDAAVPLLERSRFLSIFHSNLDEFFMKRLAMPKAEVKYNQSESDALKLKKIRKKVLKLFIRADDLFISTIKPRLIQNGIFFVSYKDTSSQEKKTLKKYFIENVLPILTPLAVDSGHPFPHISSLSTSLAVRLQDPESGERQFARVKLPKLLPHYILVERKGSGEHWISQVDVIKNHLDLLFPGMDILSSMAFRVTRNIEFEREEESAEDLLEMISQELKDRKFGRVVKLEHEEAKDPYLVRFVQQELDIDDEDIYSKKEPLDYGSLATIYDSQRSSLKYKKWVPITPREFLEPHFDIFEKLKKENVLVHHPYESFTGTVEKFIIDAAEDPDVQSIKLSLYRTGKNSRLVKSLITAAESGKEVVCVIELKARLDEENNISWAKALEASGAHIVYGIPSLKTHCKVSLVTRREFNKIQSYAHIGTGNYHAGTAKAYTDLGLLTTDPDIIEDVIGLFHFLTGYSKKRDYKKLLVAPVNMKAKILDLISNEIRNKQKGQPAEIMIKVNNLEDRDVIEALYEASDKGVRIRLAVRTICTLVPGKKKLSENISVHSVVDRFLEHHRVLYFRNGAAKASDGKFYLGSADWMFRNLNRRVEVAVPIESEEFKREALKLLESAFLDNTQSWKMQEDGSYVRIKKKGGAFNFQSELMSYYRDKNKFSSS